VEHAIEDDHVEALVGLVGADVRDDTLGVEGLGLGNLAHLADPDRRHVDAHHPMAGAGEYQRIAPLTAAEVEDRASLGLTAERLELGERRAAGGGIGPIVLVVLHIVGHAPLLGGRFAKRDPPCSMK